MEIINKGTKIRQIFKTLDKNHNGTLSRSEFREAMEMFKLGLSTEEVELMVQEADSNRDGLIDYEEFCEFVNPVGNTLKAALARVGKTADLLRVMHNCRKTASVVGAGVKRR